MGEDAPPKVFISDSHKDEDWIAKWLLPPGWETGGPQPT